jgi:AcrR family transcriptional regulator
MAAVKTAQRAPRLSRKAQGEQTRRAILHAAVELYAETGVRGTGLIAIGERAGVHHATVLYHYRSSRELLLAVLDERDRQFTDFSREAFKEGGLRALQNLPIAARFNVEHPVWTKLFAVLQAENLDAEAEAHPYFLARRNNLRRLLIARLREAKRRGEIRAEVDETATADVIQAFMSGAQTQHLLDPKHTDLIAIYQHFTALLIRDLTGKR